MTDYAPRVHALAGDITSGRSAGQYGSRATTEADALVYDRLWLLREVRQQQGQAYKESATARFHWKLLVLKRQRALSWQECVHV